MIMNGEECHVMTFNDISPIKRVAMLEQKNKQITLHQSSITHELLTPLRCIINFAERMQQQFNGLHFVPREPTLIFNTAKLLHS